MAALMALCFASGAQALNQEVPGCGNLSNAFGPWDYRIDRGEPLMLVESAHFTPIVEALVRGATGKLGQDIDYTLRAFPNHHRALVAAARLADRDKTPQPQGFNYSIDCYFERAIQFKPEDTTARMLYADWLARHGQRDIAMKQLQFVEAKAGDNPITVYNLGLVYFQVGDHASALRMAHRAAALGVTRPELTTQLKNAGKWTEAPPPAPAASAASSAAPASGPAAPASAATP
ncbi:TIGR02996 domain-containing protein [Rubrivivax gelatinosus]|nr:TIGR02996 domain-containing protein [Rubrivivax gelatinosus]